MDLELFRYDIGTDMSKDKFDASFGLMLSDGTFKIKAQRKFKNIPSEFANLYEWIEKNRKDKSIHWSIILEVTGVYHEELLYYLYDMKCPVSLQLGKHVNKYLASLGHKSKNDKLDGRGMAQMACERKCKLWEPISEYILSIKTLLRHRKSLIISKTQFENRLHAQNHSKLKLKEVNRSLNLVIAQHEKEIKKIEKKAMKMLALDDELKRKVLKIANSLKGLGVISVLTIVAETNGFESFTSQKQLVSYSGLDVKERTSGKYIGKSKISKQGNAVIRSTLYMPSLAIVRCKVNPFYNYYIRLLVRNGGIKNKALVAVQRKLLTIIYTLWKKDEAFDENFQNKTEELKMVVPI